VTQSVSWQRFWNALSCSYTDHAGWLRSEVTATADFYRDCQRHSTGMHTDCMTPGGVDKELVMPLPAPPGIARRLVFFRTPGHPFGDAERDAAVLLQPHIADALAGESIASRVHRGGSSLP